MNSLKTFKNDCITQTEQGLFIKNIPFLPVTIQSITPHYHFTSYSSFRKEYEIKLVETASIFPDKPLILRYDPDRPMDFLKDLNSYGLKSDLLAKDSIETWNLIVEGQKTGLLEKNPLLSSDHSGWILFEDNLYYMTSLFAISKKGILREHHCITPDACLLFDEELDETDAFLETMNLVNFDFEETMPIVITQVLSLLHPLIEPEKLYSCPGLFLSGPTSTGKTELALAFGTLFGNPATKELKNFLILQSVPKDFEYRLRYFPDTTFILDDARKSPAYSVRQSIIRLIDKLGRSAFIKNETHLIPIVTGEPQVLNEHLPSLRNRFIEVYLNPSDERMKFRRKLIKSMKNDPLPLRTCLLYFIKFLCGIRASQLSKEIENAKRDFLIPFCKQTNRNDDNLFMHYLGLRLFMYYGKSIGCIPPQDYKGYIDNYIKTLDTIAQNSALYSKEGRLNTLIGFICNSVISGRLRIYMPDMQSCYYYHYSEEYSDRKENTYGHYSIIDDEYGYSGVYIRNRSFLPCYPTPTEALPVLIIHAETFFNIISEEKDLFKKSHGYDALPLQEMQIKKFMSEEGLLYTEKRYEQKENKKEHYNYTCSYPYWNDGDINNMSSLCLNMESPYAKKLIDCIISASNTTLPHGCIYEMPSLDIREYYLNNISNLKSFRLYQI